MSRQPRKSPTITSTINAQTKPHVLSAAAWAVVRLLFRPIVQPIFQTFLVYHHSNERHLENIGTVFIWSLFFFFTSAAAARFFEIVDVALTFFFFFEGTRLPFLGILKNGCIASEARPILTDATWSERKPLCIFLQGTSFDDNMKCSCLSVQCSSRNNSRCGARCLRKCVNG